MPIHSPFMIHSDDLSDHDLVLLFSAHSSILRDVVLNDPRTPSTVIEGWFPDATPDHLAAIAQHPNTPPAILQLLARSSWQARRVARHPRLPLEILEQLCDSPDEWVRRACAINPALTPTLAAHLSHDPDPEVVERVLAHPHLSPDILIQFATLSRTNRFMDYLRSLATNPIATDDFLQSLLPLPPESPEFGLSVAIAKHPAASPNLLCVLTNRFQGSRDSIHELWITIAAHHRCPSELLHQFAKLTTSTKVREALAQAPNSPTDLLIDLATSRTHVILRALFSNPNTPAHIKLKLSLRFGNP